MIRRDIYSVVLWDGFAQEWCHERMFRSLRSAKLYARRLREVDSWELVKVVHPCDMVVRVYVAGGSLIAA